MMKNKKGIIPQMFIFLGVIVAFVLFMFGTGAITSFILKRTIAQVPTLFWIGLGIFVLIVLTRRKK